MSKESRYWKGIILYMEEKQQDNQNQESERASDFEFLQEKIKERPIDKKKLLQRMVITASLALLFGLVACLTFLLLEPVLNNWLYPEEEPQTVTFPQEKDEMLPEDMLTEGETGTQTESETETAEQVTTQIATEETPASEVETAESASTENPQKAYLTEYQAMHDSLHQVYQEASTSIVTVTAVKSDVDWFNNTYQSEGNIAGVIIANNNRELLILTRKSPLDKAQSILVNFCNGVSAEGSIKKYDVNTNLAVIAVDLKYLRDTTLDYVSVATLGSSVNNGLAGSIVIAVGNIQGYNDSVCYGMITSVGNVVTLADNQYKMLTTDIYASQSASGILLNTQGQVIGIIDNTYNHSDTKNLLSAIGVSELKGMITKLSNAEDVPYIGIYAQDIASNVRTQQGLPQGAYVSDIDMDSPAMINGIQKGDIIVQVGSTQIHSATDYMNAVRGCTIEHDVEITILRASKDDYEQMMFTVQPKARN